MAHRWLALRASSPNVPVGLELRYQFEAVNGTLGEVCGERARTCKRSGTRTAEVACVEAKVFAVFGLCSKWFRHGGRF